MSHMQTPPIMVRSISNDFSLEDLIIPKDTAPKPISLDELIIQPELNSDTYFLSQLIYGLYINIFISAYTNFIYKNIVNDIGNELYYNISNIKDPYLKEIISTAFVNSSWWYYPGTDNLNKVLLRFNILNKDTDLAKIAAVVLFAYSDNKITELKNATLYGIQLSNVTDYENVGLSLTKLYTTNLVAKTESYGEPICKLLFGIIDSAIIEETLQLDNSCIVHNIAKLALPLDPTAITATLNNNAISHGCKVSIPLTNYLAILIKEYEMGTVYILSKNANPRRVLTQSVHNFCGTTSYYGCLDIQTTRIFLEKLFELNKFINIQLIDFVISDINKAINNPNITTALEASKDDDGAFSDDIPDTVTETVDKSNDDVDTSSSDNDPDSGDGDGQDPNSDPTVKNNNDNIDRTSDVGQDSAAASGVYIPLALPTETIDDHLLRLAILQYVSDLGTDPNPDITPKNLEILTYWCERWLFVASIDQTKKLLVKLKIDNKVKELFK